MKDQSFIFSWDIYGIESIVPISKYEHWDQEQLMSLLRDGTTKKNPLDGIIRSLILRARYNPQRHYEIYAIKCDGSLDEEFWKKEWEENPQFTADLVREKGLQLYSDRQTKKPIIT